MTPTRTRLPKRYASRGWLAKGYPTVAKSTPTALPGPTSRFTRLKTHASTASVSASGRRTSRPASQVAPTDSRPRFSMRAVAYAAAACCAPVDSVIPKNVT